MALDPYVREEILAFLKANINCFTRSHADMTGIDEAVITYHLNVSGYNKPVPQKRWKFVPKRNKIINDKVEKLLANGSIREVQYSEWFANVVVVQKKNGK